jgi:hypothetical protein
MRCEYKNCGGLIVKQMAFGPYPERFYCQSCGREPRLEDPEIEKFHNVDHPKGGQSMSEVQQTKTCTKCQTEKAINEFGILRSSEDGHNPLCFDCKRKRDRTSKTKQANKAEARDQRSKPGRAKTTEPPQKEIVAHHKEPAEAQLIRAFKKTTIKSFIRDDLIPMLERLAEEKFE